MANYDAIDLAFSWDGDFSAAPNGDLLDTSDDHIVSLENEIRDEMKSEFGDWQLHPQRGANISEYRGEPNTREVGLSMRDRAYSRLVAAGLVRPEDLTIRVVPVSISQVMIIIRVHATATPNNRLTVGQPLVVSLLYDTVEDSVFFFQESKTSRDFRSA